MEKKVVQPVKFAQVHRCVFKEVTNEKGKNCASLAYKYISVHWYYEDQNICFLIWTKQRHNQASKFDLSFAAYF